MAWTIDDHILGLQRVATGQEKRASAAARKAVDSLECNDLGRALKEAQELVHSLIRLEACVVAARLINREKTNG